jgi:hypothetical protein
MRRYSLESAQNVIDLLDGNKVREVLRGIHRDIMAGAIGVAYDDPADHSSPEHAWPPDCRKEASDVEMGKLSPARSEVVWSVFTMHVGKIQDALAKYVVDRLPRPRPIELADLTQAFYEAARVPHEAFDSGYDVFVGNVERYVLAVRSTKLFAIGRASPCEVRTPSEVVETVAEHGAAELIGEAVAPNEEPDADSPVIIWQSKGVIVELLGEAPAALDTDRPIPPSAWYDVRYIYAKITGVMSESACDRLHRELRQLLPSIVRSVSLLVSIYEEPEEGLPRITVESLQRHLGFTRSCLNSYYASPTKKDSFDRRIRNAIHLLGEADTQTHNAIGLALCIAAIEALLGKKGEEIANALADHVGALLEPEPGERANAVEFVKNLYGIRSDVLHGRSVEGDAEALQGARVLAAGVLSAIISRCVFLKRCGFEPETPDGLFNELRKARFQPGQAAGVGESIVRALWRGRDEQ